MAALTLELYERILALVAPRELRASCNGVLGDELSDVERAVDDVAAAFARLEEVRDAVAKLEHGKAPVGRSAGLMAVMDSTIAQQRDLETSLRKMTEEGAGSGKESSLRSGRKRKRTEEPADEKKGAVEMEKPSNDGSDGTESGSGSSSSGSSSSSSDSSTESEGEEPAPVKAKKAKTSKTTQASEGHESDSSELQLAHKCLHTISHVVVIKKKIVKRMRGDWTRTLLELKRLIERQSHCSGSAVDAPAVEVAARALLGVVEILDGVTWTPKHVDEMQMLLATLKNACANSEVLRTHFYRYRAQLESLEMGVPKSMSTDTKSSQLDLLPGEKSGKRPKYYELTRKIAFLSFEERTQRIPVALTVLQKAMADDTKGEGVVRILKSVHRVKNWVVEVPRRHEFREKYRSFATNVEAYGKKIQNGEMGASLLRPAAEILKVVDAGPAASGKTAEILDTEQDKRKQLTVKVAASRHRVSDKTVAMKKVVVSSLAKVNEWQDGVFSMAQVDKVMKQLGSVVYYAATDCDWDPRADSALHECVDKLAACVQQIKKQELRDKRAATVKEWRAALDH